MGLIRCNLRVLMAERGLNIQKVKDQTTLSRTTISNLYNNYGTGIQFDTLKQLCELLKCKPGDLISYVDLKTSFEVNNKQPDFSVEESSFPLDDEGEKINFVSRINTNLNINCKISYEGEKYDFNSQIFVSYSIDANKNIYGLTLGTSNSFEYEVDKIKLPGYVESYVYGELDDFIIKWGCDFFSEDLITGAKISFIDNKG